MSAKVSEPKKRKSGIPTGHAGEYFVMGELLRRGFDAQLADRNTAGYDLLMGYERMLEKVQVKSVRTGRWMVQCRNYEGEMLDRITIFVRIGDEDAADPVRYFITKNRDIADGIRIPKGWTDDGRVPLEVVLPYENLWDVLKQPSRNGGSTSTNRTTPKRSAR